MSFPFLQFETYATKPIEIGQQVVTPWAQSLTLVVPGCRGSLIWSRPVSVLVQQPSGKVYTQHIGDMTRVWELLIAGSSLAFVVFLLIVRRRMNRGR